MAKRSRVASRPGQQRNTRRPQRGTSHPAPASPAPQTTGPSTSLTDAEEARAAELEAEIVDQEKGPQRGKVEKGRPPDPATVRARSAQQSGLLAARAAEEYSYVTRDLRRIGVVSGSLLIVLFVLYLLIEVLHVF